MSVRWAEFDTPRLKYPYTALPFRVFPLAKPNYTFEKRQREIAKKKLQDQKQAKKKAAKEAAKPPRDPSNPSE